MDAVFAIVGGALSVEGNNLGLNPGSSLPYQVALYRSPLLPVFIWEVRRSSPLSTS